MALTIAGLLFIGGIWVFRYGTDCEGGAGAAGSILMAIGAILVIGSIFALGVSLGMYIA